MTEHIFKYVHARQIAWASFALATVAALALFAHATSSAVQAQTASNDCFGGALADDPINCEVFQWAHNTGVIEVDAVYRAGGALYIFLTQSDHLDATALKKMLAKTQEIARRTGEHGCVLKPQLCGAGVLVAEPLDISGYILPKSSVHQTIELFPGGAEARRSFPGWRVFHEFWPRAAGAVGATGTEGDFDISGVDRTNFPTLAGNCNPTITRTYSTYVYDACKAWQYVPGLGIANVYRDRRNDKVYYYVKAVSGEKEARIAAAKKALMNAQPDYYTEERLVVLPVPHDFEELWRWSLVLDRFANSSGNTLGITFAGLRLNELGRDAKEDVQYLFPLEDAPDLTDYIWEHENNQPDVLRWRLIIDVVTLEFEKTVAGLPRLLKQLEIPESAVGLIREEKHRLPERAFTEPGVSDGNVAQLDIAKSSPLDLPEIYLPTAVADVDIEPDVPQDQPRGDAVLTPTASGDVPLPPTGGNDSALRSWWIWAAAAFAVLATGLGGILAFRRRSASEGGPTS